MSEISKLNQYINIKKIDKGTLNIQILNNEILISIVGQFNQNLIELEKLTNTTIFFRGNSITVKGNSENIKKVRDAIVFLKDKFLLTNLIEKNDIVESSLSPGLAQPVAPSGVLLLGAWLGSVHRAPRRPRGWDLAWLSPSRAPERSSAPLLDSLFSLLSLFSIFMARARWDYESQLPSTK